MWSVRGTEAIQLSNRADVPRMREHRKATSTPTIVPSNKMALFSLAHNNRAPKATFSQRHLLTSLSREISPIKYAAVAYHALQTTKRVPIGCSRVPQTGRGEGHTRATHASNKAFSTRVFQATNHVHRATIPLHTL